MDNMIEFGNMEYINRSTREYESEVNECYVPCVVYIVIIIVTWSIIIVGILGIKSLFSSFSPQNHMVFASGSRNERTPPTKWKLPVTRT
jgi:hypothetical protein